MNEQNPNPVDFDEAVEEFGDKALFMEILKSFAVSLEEQKFFVRNCVDREDFASLQKEAHKIKGGASNVFATPLYQVSMLMETAAKDKDSEGINGLLPKLEEEIQRFLDYMSSP